MKLLSFLSFLICLLVPLALASDSELLAWEPKVIEVAAAPFPKARVTSIDVEAGTFLFDWLDADEQRVDSGNSVGRFTPLDPAAYPDDDTLAAAIAAAAQ